MNTHSSVDQDALKVPAIGGHRLWVRLTHWLVTVAVFALIYSGVAILMVHPRLYWGKAGNNLTHPLLEVPVGPNYRQGSWAAPIAFYDLPNSAVTANRLIEPWNENSWARSLHFLAAWFFLMGLMSYLATALVTGHARRNILPQRAELAAASLLSDVKAHLRLPQPAAKTGPPYSILQKLAYAVLAWVALPLMFLTGVAMSPAITSSYPILLDVFGGSQSARTLHFFTFAFIVLFLVVHLAMVLASGPVRQLRAMILGR